MSEDLQDRFNRLTEQYARAMMDQGSLQAELKEVSTDRDRLAAEIVQIRSVLGEVAVYEGLVDASPTATLVAELVRDHEELEKRIDAAVAVCLDAKQYAMASDEWEHSVMEVARLLKGGRRTPDDPSELEPDGD